MTCGRVDPFDASQPDRWWVDSDNRHGARAATEHLYGTGRRRVVTISGPADMPAARDRLAGWRDAVHDLSPDGRSAADDPGLVEQGDFSEQSGAVAMARLLERVPDLDGVFAANDLMAMGALRALRESGRRVP